MSERPLATSRSRHATAASPKVCELRGDRWTNPVAAANEARAPRPRAVERVKLQHLKRRPVDGMCLCHSAEEIARKVGRNRVVADCIGYENDRGRRAVTHPRPALLRCIHSASPGGAIEVGIEPDRVVAHDR